MDAPKSAQPVDESSCAYPTRRQRQILWNALTMMAALSLIGGVALIFYGFITFLNWSYPILLPIGLAVILALVLDPLVTLFQRRGISRASSTLTVCMLAAVGFLLFWAYLLPPLVSQIGDFFKSLPSLLDFGGEQADSNSTAPFKSTAGLPLTAQALPVVAVTPETNRLTLAVPPALPSAETELLPSSVSNRYEQGREEIKTWLKANLPAIKDSIQKNIAKVIYSSVGPVGQAFGFLLGFGFVPIYVYYFLADQDHIARHWHELVPMRQSKVRDEVVAVLAEINTSLVGYFRGQIVVALCNGALTFIGLALIGVPKALVLGIITGALSIVPFLGIVCSIIPALLLGYLSAKDDPTLQWLRPVLVLGVFAVVQMIESMLITPRVQSHSTGLHPLAIILGILFWSMLLPGLLGPIVAVPLTCAGVVLLRRYIWQVRKAE